MKEPAKNLSKIQVDTTVDKADKNREKMKKLQTSDLSYFFGKSYFNDYGLQII